MRQVPASRAIDVMRVFFRELPVPQGVEHEIRGVDVSLERGVDPLRNECESINI